MINIMLFGPPGVGKSTVIGVLKTKGIGALDLEDLYPSRIRFQIPAIASGKVLGMADLDPKRKYNGKKVLLTAAQDIYDQRRADRDGIQSGKSEQKRHLVKDWEKDVKWDMVLDTTKLSAEQTADRIIAFIKKGGHFNGKA